MFVIDLVHAWMISNRETKFSLLIFLLKLEREIRGNGEGWENHPKFWHGRADLEQVGGPPYPCLAKSSVFMSEIYMLVFILQGLMRDLRRAHLFFS